jgi:hypothetical protein
MEAKGRCIGSALFAFKPLRGLIYPGQAANWRDADFDHPCRRLPLLELNLRPHKKTAKRFGAPRFFSNDANAIQLEPL